MENSLPKSKLEAFIESSVEKIKNQVGDKSVIVLVSGGVASAVKAAMLLKALPSEKVYAIHINNGFLRKNECTAICENLKELGLKHLLRIDAKDSFFNDKIKISDKELGPITKTVEASEKRAIIEHAFWSAVEKAVEDLCLDFDGTFVAQGSSFKSYFSKEYCSKINVSNFPFLKNAREKGHVLEANDGLAKEETREVGRILGLSEEVVNRQPFPSAGLAVRVLCNEQKGVPVSYELEGLESGQRGVVLPFKTAERGKKLEEAGDLAILFGKASEFSFSTIYETGKQVVAGGNGKISRVTYSLTTIDQKKAADIKLNKMFLNENNVELLREIDVYVAKLLGKSDTRITQAFSVLLPISTGIAKPYSVAIRAFMTNDFVSGRPAFIGDEVEQAMIFSLAKDIVNKFYEVGLVLYDITDKPPAMCEWE